MILDSITNANIKNFDGYWFFWLILIVGGILDILSVIQLIYVKKNYKNKVEALITKVNDVPDNSPSYPGRSGLSQSSSGGIYYDVKYIVGNKEYNTSLKQTGRHKEKCDDIVLIKYRKDDSRNIRFADDNHEIGLILLFSVFVVGYGGLLLFFL